MPTSLLSLPDELLVLVVDQAIGEYAPRLYKQRQETACALALVNKRVGRIAGDKLLQAVHISLVTGSDRWATELNEMRKPSKVRALCLGRSPGWHICALDFTSFAAVRDLRLVSLDGIRLDDIAQLRELRSLVLSQVGFLASRPFVALKLERLGSYFCVSESTSSGGPFTAAGCPSLKNLYLGSSLYDPPYPVDDGLLVQVDTLVLETFDSPSDPDGSVRVITAGALSKEAFLEKALFDLRLDDLDLLPDRVEDAKHVRVHVTASCVTYDSACADRINDLADVLDVAFPRGLETLYLPLALDTLHVVLFRDTRSALTKLVDTCARRRVEVVFEHDLDADQAGEDRASPHFEARCRRIKAERAAAASATTSGARAAS